MELQLAGYTKSATALICMFCCYMDLTKDLSKQIVVNGFDFFMSPKELRAAFPSAVAVHLKRHNGFAYVTFRSKKEVDDLLHENPLIEISNKRIYFTSADFKASPANNLHVVGFHESTTVEELVNAFPGAVFVNIFRQKGHAYVIFKSEEDLNSFVEKKLNITIRGKRLIYTLFCFVKVDKGGEGRKVRVTGFDTSTTKEDLYEVFPNACFYKLLGDQGHAYVTFHSKEEADHLLDNDPYLTIRDKRLFFNSVAGRERSTLRLYCSGIPPSTTQTELEHAFPAAKSISYLRDQGCAYVFMKSKVELDKYVRGVKTVTIQGKKLLFNHTDDAIKARGLCQLYCAGFDSVTDEIDLQQIFPNAVNISLLGENESRHAYIHFKTEVEVDEFVQSEEELILYGKKLFLNYTDEKFREKEPLSLYCVGFDPETTSRRDLQEVFPAAQYIICFSGKSHAYVYFKTEQEVADLVESGREYSVGGSRVFLNYCGDKAEDRNARALSCLCHESSVSYDELKQAFPTATAVRILSHSHAHVFFKTAAEVERMIEDDHEVLIRGQKLALTYVGARARGRSVVCSGFDPGTSEDELQSLFPTAISVHLVADKGFAYLDFKSKYEAHTAVEMNVKLRDTELYLVYIGDKTIKRRSKQMSFSDMFHVQHPQPPS